MINLNKTLPLKIELKNFQIKEICYEVSYWCPLSKIGLKNGLGTKSEGFNSNLKIINIPVNEKITSIVVYEK